MLPVNPAPGDRPPGKRSRSLLRRSLLFALCVVPTITGTIQAAEFHNALSLQGFTGILNTPNAGVTREGSLSLLYSNQVESPWRSRARNQDNYIFSAGLLPFAEIGARLTDGGADIMDLSANLKLQVPFLPKRPYLPDLAVGMQDIGGGSSHLRTTYAVATKELWRLRLSLGYGAGPDRLKGIFGGAEIKALEWLYLLGEYDTRETNAGVRIVTPHLMGHPVQFQLTAKTSLDHRPGNLEFGLGLQFPLGKSYDGRPPTPASGETATAPDSAAGNDFAGPAPEPAGAPEKRSAAAPAPLDLLQERLVKAGFQNVRVGSREDELLVVEYENSRYNHNELDGLGVVAGAVVETVPAGFETLRIVLKKKAIPLVQLSGPLVEFRRFFRGEISRTRFSGNLFVSTRIEDTYGVRFLQIPSPQTFLASALLLYPGLQTFVGTEVGAFDYLLSLKLDYYLNGWKGAVLNLRADVPLLWSDEFRNSGAFRSNREDSKLERAMFYQAFKPFPDLLLNLGGGMFLHDLYGTVNELSWTPGNGNHRFGLRQAYLDRSGDGGNPVEAYLGSYRYYLGLLDLHLEGTGGQFMNRDRGGMAELRRFFGDTSLSVYYKYSKPDSGTAIQAAGVNFSFPLTPRRDMAQKLIQIRGTEEWSYSQETKIVGRDERNSVTISTGVVPKGMYNLQTVFQNRDRLNMDYIKANIGRLRDAWETYGRSPAE